MPEPISHERELRFTAGDMELFAAASGDRSPLHTDPAFGRRTAFGECIVYGGLETMAMLGLLPAEVRARVRSIRSLFPGAILPETPCIGRAQHRPGRPGEWEVRLTGRGRTLARMTATVAPRAPGVPESVDPTQGARTNGALIAGLELGGDYSPGPELAELAARFGIEDLDAGLQRGIAWASNVVGTTIPGFDGLCAAVTLVAGGEADEGARQWVRVREHDERTDRVLLEGALMDGTGVPRCFGLIECFPFAPTPPPASAALTGRPQHPPGGTAVVVGASRGAGAALTLALLEQGYAVHAIYAQSVQAAGDLRRLAGAYAERLTLHQADAGEPAALTTLAGSIAGPLDGLALCAAPPPLPMSLTGESAEELGAYVAQSVRLASAPLGAFAPSLRREGNWIVFYSAATVDRPGRDLPQFAAAKSALEGLARWTAATTPGAHVIVARVPKMRTDLVNTPSARRAAAPPQDVAAAIVQRLADGDRGLSILEADQLVASAAR